MTRPSFSSRPPHGIGVRTSRATVWTTTAMMMMTMLMMMITMMMTTMPYLPLAAATMASTRRWKRSLSFGGGRILLPFTTTSSSTDTSPTTTTTTTTTTTSVTAALGIRGGDEDDEDDDSSSTTSTTSDSTVFLDEPISTTAATTATTVDEEPSLDEKVYAAMKKLGMSPPEEEAEVADNCQDGVCTIPPATTTTTTTTTATTTTTTASGTTSMDFPQAEQDPNVLAAAIAEEMKVDSRLAMAAIGATSTLGGPQNQRIYNKQAAQDMIQYELDLIEKIAMDDPNVQTLVGEGYDAFLSRRALAFAENNMEDARAILVADEMDEEEETQLNEEEAARAQLREEAAAAAASPDLVEIKTDFDPTALPVTPNKAAPAANLNSPAGMPKPAAKETVVFEATTAQLQELVLESPVPVLLDIYADWCGPCKVLGPALEEMAVKSGGAFRLVKVNSDNERPVSGALEVTALPTVFGLRDGKIVNMFQGMPRSEDMMKNFMMGLFGMAPFTPAVTDKEAQKYKELTAKLIKTAGAACFSFAARENLADRITTKLDDLVKDDSAPDVESAATLLRTLMNNVVKDPYEPKYRKINLENKMIASKIGNNANILAVLKCVGFSKSGSEMTLGQGKKVLNVAPLVVARDCIDKWIQKNRNEMAAAARRRKDEADRVHVQAALLAAKSTEEDVAVEEEEEEVVDPTICSLKLRVDGKKKVHDVSLNEDDPLSAILGTLGIDFSIDKDVQITCVAKKLVVKSSDDIQMQTSLKDHGLMPSASIVVKVAGAEEQSHSAASSLKERAAGKKKKTGSHTMQSIGIYAKDDNNKAELIDGGGGVWYEHDVSDDEEEESSNGSKAAEDGSPNDPAAESTSVEDTVDDNEDS